MVNQKPIQVHDTTHDLSRLVKIKYQAKIGKILTDNEWILELVKDKVKKEDIKID